MTCINCGKEPKNAGSQIGRVCQERVRAAMVAALSDPQARKDRLAWVLDPAYGLPAPGKAVVTPEDVLEDIQRSIRIADYDASHGRVTA